jgi:putative SOS response-associated peptidase YedK
MPALWGFIPRWEKSRDHEFNTVNFRAENMAQSRMYKPAFNRGQRCVMVCEGYYEHQRVPYRLPPHERSIYYVYASQVKMESQSSRQNKSINLMHIAGIFDKWTDADGSHIYNFTMLSMDAGKDGILSWMHPRVPVILEDSHQVAAWLNYAQVSGDKAMKLMRHPQQIMWHEVSKHVLDINHKDWLCNKPMKTESDDNED